MNEIVYRTLNVNSDIKFDIAVDKQSSDLLSQEITDRVYVFPSALQLAFDFIQPEHKILDLGTHIGTFSLAATALGCQVASVEASPDNAALLKDSVARNKFEQIQIIEAAVSDHPGELEFVSGGPYGFVANPIMPGETIKVPAITIDDLLTQLGWDQVDLIKMDVEGSKVAAIRGMARLLSREDAPAIIYESNGHTLHFFGETPTSLRSALEQFGYKNYLLEAGRLIPVQSGDMQPECNVDYLAVKQFPPGLENWTVAPPMTTEDVMDALESLHIDPNPDVHAAMSWFAQHRVELAIHQVQKRLELLQLQTDVMLRDYVIHSKIPLIGGLIAWIRRNLTSHLREPYVDPILERQVAFNRRIVREINDLAMIQSEMLQQRKNQESFE